MKGKDLRATVCAGCKIKEKYLRATVCTGFKIKEKDLRATVCAGCKMKEKIPSRNCMYWFQDEDNSTRVSKLKMV